MLEKEIVTCFPIAIFLPICSIFIDLVIFGFYLSAFTWAGHLKKCGIKSTYGQANPGSSLALPLSVHISLISPKYLLYVPVFQILKFKETACLEVLFFEVWLFYRIDGK